MTTQNTSRVALAAPAILLVAAGFWAGKSLTTATVTPDVQTGTVALVGGGGDEFRIQFGGQSQEISYGLSPDINWRDGYGIWQQGPRPSCMAPLSHGQRITIGVVNVEHVGDASGGPVVVWLECPSLPIPSYPIVTPSAPATGS
jgi:hypothetical protein